MARPEAGGPDPTDGSHGPVLTEARELFAACSWNRCVERLTTADARTPLTGEELLLLGQAAQLNGRTSGPAPRTPAPTCTSSPPGTFGRRRAVPGPPRGLYYVGLLSRRRSRPC